MNRILIPLACLTICGSLSSAPSNDISALVERIDALEANLGDLRYVHLTPKLEVVIENKGIRAREENFGLKEYYLSGKIFLKEAFPVSNFGLNITYKISFENGSEYDGVIVVEEFEGEVASFETIPFVNEPVEQLEDQPSRIKGVSFDWWPKYNRPLERIEFVEK